MIFDNNVKSVWNQNERKQLILTDDHNTFSTTNWVDLTLNRWGQKRTHAKIHPDVCVYSPGFVLTYLISETLISLKSFMIKQHQAPRLIFSHASLLKYIHLKPIFLVSSASKPHHVFLLKVQVVETKDYSEMQERLDLVGDQRSRAREMVAQGQVRSGGAGAAVALGLGAGARGSMSAVRGRNVAGRSG